MTDWARDYFEHGYGRRWLLGPPTDQTAREADLLWRHLRLSRDAEVLDVGCGHGGFAIALCNLGAQLIGIDFSVSLLHRAATLARSCGVQIRWVRGDMRDLPIRTQVMQAAMLYDAFGFFDTDAENQRVLVEIARVLRPRGRLALKVVNAQPLIAEFRPKDEQKRGETVVQIVRTLLSNPVRLIEDIDIDGPDGSTRYQRRQRLYSLNDMLQVLEIAGLIPVLEPTTVAGAAFDAQTSSSMILIVERGT